MAANPNPNVATYTFPIPMGQNYLVVSGLSIPFTPVGAYGYTESGSSGTVIWATVDLTTLSTGGATFNLSGAPLDNNQQLVAVFFGPGVSPPLPPPEVCGIKTPVLPPQLVAAVPNPTQMSPGQEIVNGMFKFPALVSTWYNWMFSLGTDSNGNPMPIFSPAFQQLICCASCLQPTATSTTSPYTGPSTSTTMTLSTTSTTSTTTTQQPLGFNWNPASGAQLLAGLPATLYPSVRNVSGGPSSITTITLQLIAVTSSQDFARTLWVLVGPTGNAVYLMAGAGGFGTHGGFALNLTFKNGRPSVCSAQLAPNGTFLALQGGQVVYMQQPVEAGVCPIPPGQSPAGGFPGSLPAPAPLGPYQTSLASFVGTNANGQWKLFAANLSAFGSGQLQTWQLSFT